MTTKTLPNHKSLSRFMTQIPALDSLSRKILFSKFKDLKHGFLEIRDHSGNRNDIYQFGENFTNIKVTITIHRSCFYSRTLLGGSIGNAESYVDGDWDTQDLTKLVRLFVLNRELLQKIDGSLINLFSPLQRLVHGLNHNSLEGSRNNIRSHYDIGNDFFHLFLDSTMMYSSGVFRDKETTLVEASIAKIKLVCEKLELKPEDHLVEIGTGWGSLAIYAAKHYGCQVTTTTISQEQFNYAQEKIRQEGLENKITLLFEDYRNLKGTYNKLVSIEMIEAVGLDNLDTYFDKCSSLLTPDGLMVIQAITIRDQFYENARRSVDFIQRHIFPGSGIPSVQSILTAMATQSDLVLTQQNDYAEDYAQTLYYWSKKLSENEFEITKLGYPDFLYRLWQYYFAYCEGGFRERAIGLSQLTFAKPSYKNRSLL